MSARKSRNIYLCRECGHQHTRWQGNCSACGSWNTLEEEQAPSHRSSKTGPGNVREATLLDEVVISRDSRTATGLEMVDKVLGGGLVEGALVLLGGEPGMGKSTLILQICSLLSKKGKGVLYVSGEESEAQVKLRAERLQVHGETLHLLAHTDLEGILEVAKNLNPSLLVLDSIQTVRVPDLDSSPGSVAQVRESTFRIMEFAKTRSLTTILVGHVTKGGEIAGPRLLEHMVDVVLQFEGDRTHHFRLLRGLKNRFGPTDEIGVFEMKGDGLQPVANPAAYFLTDSTSTPGSCLSVVMEGTQPFMVEVQALVADNNFTYPKRTAMGLDPNRLSLLLAVMEKRMGILLGQSDVYVNLAGGVKSNDPGLDLAVILAVLSSIRDVTLPPGTVALA
ncbi:DNA repair protein RadA, partial [bacterium]|nr:DNA repair protein RadA [bacterium]